MSLSKKEEVKESVKMDILNKKMDTLFKQFKEMEKEKALKYINQKENKK